jgi:hypothetical protein
VDFDIAHGAYGRSKNMGKHIHISIIQLIILFFFHSCALPITLDRNTPTNEKECIKTFTEFAYEGSEYYDPDEAKMVLPRSPWEISGKIPAYNSQDYLAYSAKPQITRIKDDKKEIWILVSITMNNSSQDRTNIIQIFYPASQNWNTISAQIGDTEFYVGELFITTDGRVWGKTIWDDTKDNAPVKSVPVLSVYDENSKRFEFVESVVDQLPSSANKFGHPWPAILQSNDEFWIFTKGKGLYNYSTKLDILKRQRDLDNLYVKQAVQGDNGIIFFEVYNAKIYSEENFFKLIPGILYSFYPETNTISDLSVPEDPWPMFSGLLVDGENNLWLGSIGYRDQDGSWILIHPDPSLYFTSAGDVTVSPPSILFESSDGIFWYKRYLDGDYRAEGTAWYDPKSGKGCQFTNVAGDLFEDTDHIIWFAAEGILFSRPLNK